MRKVVDHARDRQCRRRLRHYSAHLGAYLGAPDVESRVLGEFLDLLADEDVVLRLVRVEELDLNVEVLLLQQRLRHLHARGVHEFRQRRAIALGWATDEMTRDGGAPASLA